MLALRRLISAGSCHTIGPLRHTYRGLNMGDPSQLFTSPGGLMALLYGRTGSLSGGGGASTSPADQMGETEPGEGRKQRRLRATRRVVLRGKTHSEDLRGVPQPGNPCGPNGDDKDGGGDEGDWRARLRRFTRALAGSEALWLAALVFTFSALWELLKGQQGVVREKAMHVFCTTLEVRSSQWEYAMVMDWMAEQATEKGTRNLSLKPVTLVDEKAARRDYHSDAPPEPKSATLVPGYGKHLFYFNGVRMWISRDVDSSKQHGNFAMEMDRENDVLTLTFFTRRRNVVEQFLAQVAADFASKQHDCVRIMLPDYKSWTTVTERLRRPLDTLYLPPHVKDVVEEMRAFYSLGKTYERLGIPWRRGYLFEGPPGTGKSSLVMAIAGELGVPVCILSCGSGRLDDAELVKNVSHLPRRCILLLEDFENSLSTMQGVKASRQQDANGGGGGVTLSGLLNALDGVASTEGRLLIMTSNDVSRIPIPDALLRPGRIDRRVRFDTLTADQMHEMQTAFTQALAGSSEPVLQDAAATITDEASPSTASTGKAQKNISPAEFQGTLLARIYETCTETPKKKKRAIK